MDIFSKKSKDPISVSLKEKKNARAENEMLHMPEKI